MADYFVSRHLGAIEFAARQVPAATVVNSLEDISLKPGDRVFGILPVDLIANVCEAGATFFALVFERSGIERGTELTYDDLEKAGARFEEYVVHRTSPKK